MSKDEDWIDELLSKSQKDQPLVTDDVVTRIKALIEGSLSERQLPSTELTKVVKELIGDMIPTPKAEAKH